MDHLHAFACIYILDHDRLDVFVVSQIIIKLHHAHGHLLMEANIECLSRMWQHSVFKLAIWRVLVPDSLQFEHSSLFVHLEIRVALLNL